MTTGQTEKCIEVMQAFIAGKQIESTEKGKSEWKSIYHSAGITPTWDWSLYEYRVQPEPPKPIEKSAPKEVWVVYRSDTGAMVASEFDETKANHYATGYGRDVARVARYVLAETPNPDEKPLTVRTWIGI